MQKPLNIMRRHPLFRAFSGEQWAAFVERIDHQALSAGQALFNEGDIATAFYFVSEGAIRCFRSPSGCGQPMWTVYGGEFLAECVLFGRSNQYRMSAIVLKSSLLFVIDRAVYQQFMHESFDVYRSVLGVLNARLNALRDRTESLACHSSQVRVARYVLELLAKGNATRLQLPLQKNEIAVRLGLAPETLSRVLRAFQDRNLLKVEGGTLIVRNDNALEAIAYH